MALKNIDFRSSASFDFANWKLMLLMIEFMWLGVFEVYLLFTFEWVYILYEMNVHKSSMAAMSNPPRAKMLLKIVARAAS